MKKPFGTLESGEQAYLYTLSRGQITAVITDYGATLVRLYVPDLAGDLADVVLGYDSLSDYVGSGSFFGAVVGRNANRIKNGTFSIGNKTYHLPTNQGPNSLHSGPDFYKNRMWTVEQADDTSIRLRLDSPDGDQGFPGNAVIHITYTLESDGALCIAYDAVCDQDTVFNLTNHSYFNMAGHDKPEQAMDQLLTISSQYFTPADANGVPTGELRSVEGTPMDFRVPKPLRQDVAQEYDALLLQSGYDHNYVVQENPCAILTDPVSGRSMAVSTDCPGIQLYIGNFLKDEPGKDGAHYCYRGGIALETQFHPDAVNHPEWPQPITKAGESYHSETRYIFK